MKKLSIVFTVLALLFSHAMCAVVAYQFAALWWCGQYGGCSAPADVAFLFAIPFLIPIGICWTLSVVFWRKHKRSGKA